VSSGLRIYLTGRLCVVGPAGSVGEADLAGNQSRVALALLVFERRPVHRDRLADIIWGGDLPVTWNTSLNAIISKIRGQLSRTGLDGRAVVTATGGSYGVSLPSDAWVDTEDAFRRVDRAEGAARHGDVDAALQEATVASSILGRPFLGGVDGEWVDDVRRQLTTVLYRSYVVIASGWNTRGDHQLAATIAERAIDLDPIRETAYRLLIEAELGRGDSAAALRAFDRCERVIRDEFGASPAADTVALAERARHA
jgi:DNA-binding SARP family transcriptional activator